MKILHTSDWHLGHVLYNYSREEEQQNMLDRIVETVRNEQPDALLIAGDVYDTTQPSATVQKMFADSIVRMHDACPGMQIFCIAGNHDSGSRHMIFQTPWQALGVHMIGSILRDSDLEDYIFKIEGKGYIIAVPFAFGRFMPDDVFRRLTGMVAERNAREQLPVFVMGHLALFKTDYRGHDQSTDDNIGGVPCQEIDILGDDYDYVALGHIHKQQTLGAKGNVRYSGTPIAVNFDESYSGNRHGVTVVSCRKHGGPVTITPVDIDNIRPLVNIPAQGYDNWDNVLEELKSFPDDIPAYLRLNVEIEKSLKAGSLDQARLIAGTKKCRICLINPTRKEKNESAGQQSLTTMEFKELDHSEVLRMWAESKGIAYSDELKELFQTVKDSLLEFPDEYPDVTKDND